MPEILLGNIKGPKGDQGNEGPRGPQGTQGAPGKDGAGVPDGGSEGQVLAKAGDGNQQTKWIDVYDRTQTDAKINGLRQELAPKITANTEGIERLNSVKEVTLGTTWYGSEQKIYIEDVKATDTPILDVKLSGDTQNKLNILRNWAEVIDAQTGDGYITFYADGNTDMELTVLVKGV